MKLRLSILALGLVACHRTPDASPSAAPPGSGHAISTGSSSATPSSTGSSSATPSSTAVPRAAAGDDATPGAAQKEQASAPPLTPYQLQALHDRLRRLDAGGRLGIAVMHVPSGQGTDVRGAQRFPMQSVFKLPLALTVLARVERGDEQLDARVAVTPADLRDGISTVQAAGTYTVEQLLRLALQQSDNTATDLLLARCGGPSAVMAHLAAHDLRGIDVSRSEGQLLLEARGGQYSKELAERDRTQAKIASLLPVQRRAASRAYLADPRDTATPRAMVELLSALQRGRLLSKRSTRWLLDTMLATTTGTARLRAGLPEGTPLAHKTGTSDSFEGVRDALADVGLITLPGDRGHLSIAVMVADARRGDAVAEAAMAEAAAATYLAFTGGLADPR